MEKLQCKRCNHEWLPRVEEVKECPKCKSRIWNKPLTLDKIFKKMAKTIEENEIPQQN